MFMRQVWRNNAKSNSLRVQASNSGFCLRVSACCGHARLNPCAYFPARPARGNQQRGGRGVMPLSAAAVLLAMLAAVTVVTSAGGGGVGGADDAAPPSLPATISRDYPTVLPSVRLLIGVLSAPKNVDLRNEVRSTWGSLYKSTLALSRQWRWVRRISSHCAGQTSGFSRLVGATWTSSCLLAGDLHHRGLHEWGGGECWAVGSERTVSF